MSKYKIKDLADEISERVNDPKKSGFDKFIGLEHYTSGEARITRFGSTVNLDSSAKIFHTGDILIARRNVYLKRAGIVDFDGLTSGDSIVIRAKNDTIRQILPFIFNTEQFWDFATQFADGSMSKRLSPKILMEYEINLPDNEKEREKLAKTLWAINDTLDSYKEMLKQSDELVKAKFIEMFGDLEENTNCYKMRKLSEISEYWNGLTYKPTDVVEKESGILVLRSSNIQNGKLSFEDNVYVNCKIKDKQYVKENDILMCSRNGSAKLVGKVALIKKIITPTTFGAFMMIIRSDYYPFLKTFFETQAFRKQVCTGTATINQITGNMLNQVIVPTPDLVLVKKFEAFVDEIDKSKKILQECITKLENLYKKIVNQYLTKEEDLNE